ncbi:uncharacterized protein LOC108678041 [Hyalella azteca]|uniref:Uncharacterized protein LOC108678041 n=1 Tax=Hyalella azteca TaxID=294128 RepID=A0A8B7P6S5_HYAAZ|nr:uncharacterized protein LOC108678041 [Hyalella azteca]
MRVRIERPNEARNGPRKTGLYKNEYRNLTNRTYLLPASPAEWTVVLWPITMGWLLFCVLFGYVLLCVKNPVGPAYKSPPVLGAWFLLNFTLSLFCVIAWSIVYDRELVVPAAVLSILAAILSWIATAEIYRTVHEYGGWMARHSRVMLWLYRLLWHNGMAGFTAWLTIQAIYVLFVTLRAMAGMSLINTVWGVFGSMTAIIVVWFILENSILDSYGRYTFTQYPVVVVHMAGVYVAVKDLQNVNEVKAFAIALLALACVCAALRIILMFVRGFKCPLYSNNKVGEDPITSFAS